MLLCVFQCKLSFWGYAGIYLGLWKSVKLVRVDYKMLIFASGMFLCQIRWMIEKCKLNASLSEQKTGFIPSTPNLVKIFGFYLWLGLEIRYSCFCISKASKIRSRHKNKVNLFKISMVKTQHAYSVQRYLLKLHFLDICWKSVDLIGNQINSSNRVHISFC
jgi:hypothetical protein